MSTSAERQRQQDWEEGSELWEGRVRGVTTCDVSCFQEILPPSFQRPLLNVWGFFGGIPASGRPISPSCRFFLACCG